MPPPKKPKSGPTSLEQFFSKEELDTIDPDGDIRDRKGSCSGESDISQDFTKIEENEINSSDNEQRSSGLRLLRELMIKKKGELEEQRVPSNSGQTSPTSNGEKILEVSVNSDTVCDIDKKDEKQLSDKIKTETKNHSTPTSPRVSPTSQRVSPTLGSDGNILPKNAEKSQRQNVKMTKSEEKALNNMIVSSYMASLPHNASLPSVPGYISPYLYNHSFPMNSFYVNGVDEPTDLSRKLQKDNRLGDTYEKMNGFNESVLSHPLSMNFAVNSLIGPKSDDKEYLKARKNLVGMLTEPEYVGAPIGFPSQQMEREHQLNSLHFFMNGFDNRRFNFEDADFEDALTILRGISEPVGTVSVIKILTDNGNTMTSHGEPVEKVTPKDEHHHAVSMASQGNYIPMPHMFSGVSQMPSSTTPDFHDHTGRIIPMMDPSLSFIDGRKLKHDSTGQHSNKLCQVCSDNASGFHYGVWSCEGCKAFFKRSIQGPVDYVCPATNTCTIDKHRRKSCQACRLRKCYEVGMNKGTQRKERKNSSNLSSSMSKQTLKRTRADSMDNTNPRRSQTVAILDALAKADLPVVESFHNHGLPPSRVHLLNSLSKLAERELVHLINWAKNVPGYIDLSLSDQVHLIECCWMELLLLNCAFRSMEHEGKRLVFAPDLILDRTHWETVEVRRLSSFSRIHDMRQSILDALVDIVQKYHPDNLRHIPSVLLLLTHIRQAGERGISHFQRLKNEGVVTFSDLLKEMLDAHVTSEKKQSVQTG
ncbi:hypothetical protein KUTeg_013563 [Tegillarca granosa]|uniref:Estrogen receptor n=1 Tax=Tegillarca granosa TaxID=220873 RepID=A0ABQ9EU22_TEGGR|nr:hypothetical protein KUTeg_013563 [Tegillarca granosa]